jgi:hypothetical protein
LSIGTPTERSRLLRAHVFFENVAKRQQPFFQRQIAAAHGRADCFEYFHGLRAVGAVRIPKTTSASSKEIDRELEAELSRYRVHQAEKRVRLAISGQVNS